MIAQHKEGMMTSRLRPTLAILLLVGAIVLLFKGFPSTSVSKISTATPQIVVTSAVAQAPTEQVATQAPTAAPTNTSTPMPTATPLPTNTPAPTATPEPTNTPMP